MMLGQYVTIDGQVGQIVRQTATGLVGPGGTTCPATETEYRLLDGTRGTYLTHAAPWYFNRAADWPTVVLLPACPVCGAAAGALCDGGCGTGTAGRADL